MRILGGIMGKKRFIACLLIVLLITVLSVSLVACKEKNASITLPDVPPAEATSLGAGDLLLVMLESMGASEDFAHMSFESIIKTNYAKPTENNPNPKPIWQYNKFYLKGNFKLGDEYDPGAVEIGLGVLACDEDGNAYTDDRAKNNIEFFLQNGCFYLTVKDTAFYLEDIDFAWIIEKVNQIGIFTDPDNLVGTILGAIPDLPIEETSIADLIQLVSMLTFSIDNKLTTYDPDTEMGHIALKFNPDQLIKTVIGALGGTSIDSLLGGYGMQLMIPSGQIDEATGEPIMNPVSIDNFLKTLAFPPIDVYVEAEFNEYGMDMGYGLQLNVYDNIYAEEGAEDSRDYFHMVTSAKFDMEYEDFIKENIKDYVPFGLLKLRFDTEFELNVNKLDVSKLVNLFAGYEFLPEGGDLEITVNTGFVLKLDADLRLKEVDDKDLSLLLIELYDKEKYDAAKKNGDEELSKLDPIIGIYLRNRQIFVNLDGLPKGDTVALNIENLCISGANVSQWITKALDLAKNELSKIIDQYFPVQDDSTGYALTQAFATTSDSTSDYSKVVYSIGHDAKGTSYISPAIGTIIDILRYTIGFEDFISHKDNVIKVWIDQYFVAHLCDQFSINIPGLENGGVDFGKIELGINVNETGIENVYLDIALKNLFDVTGRVELVDLHYGLDKDGHRKVLDQKITNALTTTDDDGNNVEKTYISNVKDLIYSALNDLDLEFEASLHFDEGDYNISNIFGTATGLPDVTISVESQFDMNLILQIQTQMGYATVGYEQDEDGKDILSKPIKKPYIEKAKITIINVTKNPIFPIDNMTINAFYLDDRAADNDKNIPDAARVKRDKSAGVLYFDMSQFSMLKIGIPSFALGIDLTELLFSEIDKLDKYDLNIPEIVFPESFTAKSGASTYSADSYSTTSGRVASEDNILKALFTASTAEKTSSLLKIKITTRMVNRVLDLLGLDLGFNLPNDIDITLDISNGITLSVGAVEQGNKISLKLAVNKFKFGMPIKIDTSSLEGDLSSDKYGAFISLDDLTGGNNLFAEALIKTFAQRALDDVNIEFRLKVSLGAGKYDISKILGINTGLPSIPFEIGAELLDGKKEITLDLTFVIKLQSALVDKLDELGNPVTITKPSTIDIDGEEIPGETVVVKEQIISRALITIKNNKANPITPKGDGVIRLMYFDDRYEGNGNIGLKEYDFARDAKGQPIYDKVLKDRLDGNGNPIMGPDGKPIKDEVEQLRVTKTHGTLLAQLSTFNILRFVLPDLALDIDLTEVINGVLDSLSFGTISYDGVQPAAQRASLLSTIADSNAEPGKVSAISIKFTTEIINSLLKMLGLTLEFDLPSLDGDININADEGLSIGIIAKDNSQNNVKEIGAHISLIDLSLGTTLDDDDFSDSFDVNKPDWDMNNVKATDFGEPVSLNSSNLLGILIYRALDDVDIEFSFGINVEAGTYNIGEILGMVGFNLGYIPINVYNEFTLDLTVKIQLLWDEFEEGSGIARARVSIVNGTKNDLFDAGEILQIHYLDDRAKINQGIVPDGFKYGQKGKASHGSLFVDLSHFKMLGLKLPNIAVDVDLTKEIGSILSGINMSNQTVEATPISGGTSTQSNIGYMLANAIGTIADGDSLDADKAADEVNFIKVSITMQVIAELLDSLAGISMSIPDSLLNAVNGNLTIGQNNGIKLDISFTQEDNQGVGHTLSVDFGVNKVRFGTKIEDTLPSGTVINSVDNKKDILLPLATDGSDKVDTTRFAKEYGNTTLKLELRDALSTILDDTKIGLRFKVDIPAGKYNLAKILKVAGIDIDEMYVTFDNAFTLDLGLIIQLQFDTVKVYDVDPETGLELKDKFTEKLIISRAYIEVKSYSKNFILNGDPNGLTIAQLFYFDDRVQANLDAVPNLPMYKEEPIIDAGGRPTDKLHVSKTHGTLYGDLSNITIANIKLPKITIDIDLNKALDSLGTASVNELYDNGTGYYNAYGNTGYGLTGDGDKNTKLGDLNNFLAITISSKVIEEILEVAGFGDMVKNYVDISLFDFDVMLAASATNGINLTLTIKYDDTSSGTSETKNVSLYLELNTLELGVPTEINLDKLGFSLKNFENTEFGDAIANIIKSGRIEAKVNVDVAKSRINVKDLLGMFINFDDLKFNMDINLNLHEFANEIDLLLQWNFDYNNPNNSKLILKADCDGTNIMGVYVKDGNLYIDLKGLGLFKFYIEKSNFITAIVNLIKSQLSSIALPFATNFASLQNSVAATYGMTAAEYNAQLFNESATSDGMTEQDKIMSYVKRLLADLTIDNGVINAEITADLIREIMQLAGVTLPVDIDAKFSLDVFGGKLMLDADIDHEFRLGMYLHIVEIGQEVAFDVDVNAGSSDPYYSLDGRGQDELIDSILDKILQATLEGADGMWLEIINSNCVTTNYYNRTILTMRKVMDNAYGFYLSLELKRAEKSGTDVEIKIYKDGAMYVVLKDQLIPRFGISIADTIGPIWITNIKDVLRPIIGKLFTAIDDISNNVSTTGVLELENLFSSLNIMDLLGDINVTMYDVKNIRINVSLNPKFINDLMPQLFAALRGYRLEIAGKQVTIGNLRYDTVDGSAFLDRIFEGVIRPLVKSYVGGAEFLVNPYLNNDLKPQIKDFLSRLLPLPVFGEGELNANVWVLNGKLDNIQLVGYEAGRKTDSARDRFELKIYNDMSKQPFFGDINSLDLNNLKFQLPYVTYDLSMDTGEELLNQFMNKAYVPDKNNMYYDTAANNSGGSYRLSYAAPATWEIVSYSPTGFYADDVVNVSGKVFKKVEWKNNQHEVTSTNAGLFDKAGYYIAKGSASISGKPVETFVKVYVTNSEELLRAEGTTVRDITVHSGEGLPTTVLVENKKLGQKLYIHNYYKDFNVDGSNEFEKTKFTFGSNAIPDGLEETDITTTITFNLKGNNTLTKPVNIHWDDRTLELAIGSSVSVDIYNAEQFYNDLWSKNLPDENGKKGTIKVRTADNRLLDYQVKNISIKSGTELFAPGTDGKGTFANIDVWRGTEEYTTIYEVELEGYSDKLLCSVKVAPREIEYVYLNGKNLVTLNDLQTEKDLPTQAKVFFSNGDSGIYDIIADSWWNETGYSVNGKFGVIDSSQVMFRIKTAFDYNFDKVNRATVTLDIQKATIDYVSLTKEAIDSGNRYQEIDYIDFCSGKIDEYLENFDIWLMTNSGQKIDYADTISYIVRWEKKDEEGNVVETIENKPGTERADFLAKSAKEKAEYTPVYETIKNYDINFDGTISSDGGQISIRITLYFYQSNRFNSKPGTEGPDNVGHVDLTRTATVFLTVRAKVEGLN